MDLLTLAKNVAQRVEAQATQAKVPVAICVVDVHGKRRPAAPHARSAAVLARAVRAQGLHVRARALAHGRPRAAGASPSSQVDSPSSMRMRKTMSKRCCFHPIGFVR